MKAHRACDWVWWAVKHWGTRDGGNIVCVWTPNPPPNPSHASLWQCALGKKNKKLRHRNRYTMLWNINSRCCSLPTTGKRAMQVACVCVGVRAHLWTYTQDAQMCVLVLSPFALVFYTCGGGDSLWICNQQTWCCFGIGCLYIWWASCFYLRSTDALSKACVGRAAF